MNILLVEDNVGDQVIMQEAFQEAEVDCDLDIVKDGEEAIDFLKRNNPFQGAKRPDMIILDLNLPKKSGQQVLAEIKDDPFFSHIPVMILTNSRAKSDVCGCYALKANVYVGKPAGFQEYVDLANMIKVFWIQLNHYCSHTN